MFLICLFTFAGVHSISKVYGQLSLLLTLSFLFINCDLENENVMFCDHKQNKWWWRRCRQMTWFNNNIFHLLQSTIINTIQHIWPQKTVLMTEITVKISTAPLHHDFTSSYLFSDSTTVSEVSFRFCSRTYNRSSSMFFRCSRARRDLQIPSRKPVLVQPMPKCNSQHLHSFLFYYFILICNKHSWQMRENNNIEKQWKKKNYKH